MKRRRIAILPAWPALSRKALPRVRLGSQRLERSFTSRLRESWSPARPRPKKNYWVLATPSSVLDTGVFELASDLHPDWDEFGWMGDLSRDTGAPVAFTALGVAD